LPQADYQIFAEFVFHAAAAQTFFGKFTVAQFAERARKTHEEQLPERSFLDYTL
jgi:hypothetical protein